MDSLEPYAGRTPHWIKPNETERTPHRWIVADSEGRSEYKAGMEIQTLRCVDAVRWRDDLRTGLHEEWHSGESAEAFWQWVDDYCRSGKRTVLWFHNVSYDLRTLRAFDILPALGFTLEWCNLARDVSVVEFRSDHGTLVIADTYTWVPKPLAEIGGMVGVGKPPLPDDDDSIAAWHSRCNSDVRITQALVLELNAFIRGHHLGNWKPSGAGMGYAAWRHRFLTHKILVHDDSPALKAEREAMHTGRAEAWHHGKMSNGPFTEWDMHMSYCRIAAECDLPVKLFAYDRKPSKQVHKWAMRHWTVLARVRVRTDKPVVPCRHDDRTIWPVGEFETVLWQPELELITQTGGTYEVLEQWRYNAEPCLQDWARWSMFMCAQPDSVITPAQRSFVKHQSRAVIGRFGLQHSTWDEWGSNPYGWLGLTDIVDADSGDTSRMLHVGDRSFIETDRHEADSSLPQITGYIMAEARVRLWCATEIAGDDHIAHMDTDSVIVDRYGDNRMRQWGEQQLKGGWRPKERWQTIDVTGPRHYRASGRRVIPGVPRSAVETSPGKFDGQVWQSLSAAMQAGTASAVIISDRTWRVKRFDGRRPWTVAGPAEPIRLTPESTKEHDEQRTGSDGFGARPGGDLPDLQAAIPAKENESARARAPRARQDSAADRRAESGTVHRRQSHSVRMSTPESLQRKSALDKQAATAARGRAQNDGSDQRPERAS